MDTIKCKTIKTSKYNILLLPTKTHMSLFRRNPEKNYCFTLPYAYNKTVGAVFFFFFFGDDKTIIILILFTFFNVWDEICNTIPCYHVTRTINYTNIFYNSIVREWRFYF